MKRLLVAAMAGALLFASDFEPSAAILARVPEKARAKRNPLGGDRDARLAGGKLFGEHCAECHGESGQGARRGPALVDSALRDASDGEFFWILTNGVVRHGMPAWDKLPDAQRWQIVSFVRSLNETPR